jgi:hypothetical protein
LTRSVNMASTDILSKGGDKIGSRCNHKGRMEPERFALQDPHPISEKGKVFLASLGERERALHTMMSKSLGSSYFVERTHAFRKWIAATTPKR